MLIKKIEMINFRQFLGKQCVEFARGDNNVTIIMGENGAGKTTLAQAFLWVLYGQEQIEFKDKKIINKCVIEKINIGDIATAKVNLIIEEEGVEYTISRKQEYIKRNERLEVKPAILEITYKNNGQVKPLKSDDYQNFIKNILPNELSKFFIFSGERIKNMSDEIQNGKSKEFANAVRSLVGLNAVMNAINHIKDSRGMSTVIGRYNKKIDDMGDVEIKIINEKINTYENELEVLNKRILEVEPNIDFYSRESIKLDEEILSYAPAEKVKRDYDSLTYKIKDLENDKVKAVKNYIRYFNSFGLTYFVMPAIQVSSDELKKVDNVDKGIPNVHANTIEHLIKKGKCLCGHDIGMEEIKELTKLLDYLPPKSIGTLINQHDKNSKMYLREGEAFFNTVETYFKEIRRIEDSIKASIKKQTDIFYRITDTEKLRNLRNQKSEYERKARESKNQLGDINIKIGEYREKLSKEKATKEKYININNKNEKYIICREYARALFNKLNDNYSKAETSVRIKLEKKINRIFTDILEGGLHLTLDEDYNIKVSVDELKSHNDDIEQSTAQSYSVIFAFIAGIIEMAKEKTDEDSNDIFDNSVGYPLIMDAPLSAFDKKRIGKICNTLPVIAQQVIIFIKDTDGEVAENNLEDKIGRKYNIVKESLIVSRVEGVV